MVYQKSLQHHYAVRLAADYLNSFHIYGFALVSGYLFYYLKIENGRYASFTGFLSNKFKRLIVPYLFVSLVWAIPFSHILLRDDFKALIHSFCLGMAPAQLWFLLMLFFVFVLFYPISDLCSKHPGIGAVIVLLFYGVGIIGLMFLPNLFQFFRACTYVPFFWLGFSLRQHRMHRLRKIPWYLWIALHLLLFVLNEIFPAGNGLFRFAFEKTLEFGLNVCGALMAFFVLQHLANRIRWQSSKVFSFFSKHSMPIYLFHQQVIYATIALLNGHLSPYLHAPINLILSILISSFISLGLSRFRITRFFIGEK